MTGNKDRILWTVAWAIASSALILAACNGGGGGGGGPAPVTPTILSAFPPDGTRNMPADGTMSLQFNTAMDRTSVENSLSISGVGATVHTPSGFSWADSETVAFFSSPALAESRIYSLSITTAAVSEEAVALDQAYSWTFSTVPMKVAVVDDDGGLNNRVLRLGTIDGVDVDHVYRSDLDSIGYIYDVFRVGQAGNGPSASDLKAYDLVVWFTGVVYGDDGFVPPVPPTLTAADEASLASYLDSGGHLLFSSKEYLYDIGASGGPVSHPFANDYLGVLDAEIDRTAGADSTFGTTGDPVSDGVVLDGPLDSAVSSTFNNVVRGFDGSNHLVYQANGTFTADTLNMIAAFAPTTSPVPFPEEPLVGAYTISALTDSALSFSSADDEWTFFSVADGQIRFEDTEWIHWNPSMEVNSYLYFEPAGGGQYKLEYRDAILYRGWPDIINVSGGFPAYAATLLVNQTGDAVAARAETVGAGILFLAIPYEGLAPEAVRRQLLDNALLWYRGL